MDKQKVLGEIKSFLEGYNSEIKYLVNVETDPSTNIADCVIHAPNEKPRIERIRYEPFMYMKDLSKLGFNLYEGKLTEYAESKKIKHGITITKLETGNQKRLVDGFCYKITSSRSYKDITTYLRDGGLDIYEKLVDVNGNFVRDAKGKIVYKYRNWFYSPKTTEQFFISTQSRLYKGYEDYKNVHKLTFDIETTGLRYQIHRVFVIGVRDNRGFETILEVSKINDDEAEIRLIQDFFNLIDFIKPAVICGYNSENFDFEFILGRAKLLKMDLNSLPMGLKEFTSINRRANTSVKYGNTTDKYTATEMWGYSIIDILHAAKRTAAINSDLKETGLKYVAKFEKIARPNRTYINGEDNTIGRIYHENKVFLIDEKNNYIQIPDEYQIVGRKLYVLQANKQNFESNEYLKIRIQYLAECPDFIKWFRAEAQPKGLNTFIGGKNLVKQYLLDDLWETEQVDELYNQSSFMLAKIVPTTYQRICTMGTASIWNLLLTAWSYENNLAIPESDVYEHFSGGLVRCFKSGYSKRIVKIDYASLYPMIQLTYNIFPIFDITGVIKKMLLYLTTTRNIYKKIANSSELKIEEIELLKAIDPEIYHKYITNTLTPVDRAMAKVKQLPIKILNNSLFGALGSNISFNWSDNNCAARITCCGRIQLRHAITWFKRFNCIELLAVTDGINFQIPDKTTIRVTDYGVNDGVNEGVIEDMWQYGGEKGVAALIAKFNAEEMPQPYMAVDNDGESIACLNLSRINYANLVLTKDKKTGEMKEKVKLTGNTIKSKVMPEYIEEFIDNGFNMILHGQGKEFVEYYNEYAENIYYRRIPITKIAGKSRIKQSISSYLKRGKDKNGREKGKQAHMELLIEERRRIAEKLFEEHKDSLIIQKNIEKITIEEKQKLIANFMPPEPELDSTVYFINCGYKKSHGDSRKIKDKITGNERFAARLVDENEQGVQYNYEKYLAAFNSRVKSLLAGFEPDVRNKILVKLNKKGDLIKGDFNPLHNELELKNFELDNYDDSMYLQKLEVDFWNKTGYDPRLVWNGFKMHDDYQVYPEIYQNALDFLNEKMVASNKPKIKSINSEYGAGDMVLIKDDKEYHVAVYNGTYLRVIRPNIEIPKSELEIKLDKQREENQKKIKELEMSKLGEKTDAELYLESIEKKREKYFPLFKEHFKQDKDFTLEALFADVDGATMLDEFIRNSEQKQEEEADEYSNVDDDFDNAD